MNNEELIIVPDAEMMLTTLDNPYNPKTDYDKWRNWDISNDYNTEAYLDRVANIPPDMDDDEIVSGLILDAMLSIVEHDMTGMYKIV